MSALLRKPQLLARRDEAILSGRPAAEVERREILLEGLIDMGSRALHDRLEPAEPHLDQFPYTGLSIRPFVDWSWQYYVVESMKSQEFSGAILMESHPSIIPMNISLQNYSNSRSARLFGLPPRRSGAVDRSMGSEGLSTIRAVGW